MKSVISFSIFLVLSSFIFGQNTSSSMDSNLTKKHIISMELLNLRLGTIAFKYEHITEKNRNWVIKGGIIGVWTPKPLDWSFFEWLSTYSFSSEMEDEIYEVEGFGEVEGRRENINAKSMDRGIYLRGGPKWEIKGGNHSHYYLFPSFFISHFRNILDHRTTIFPTDPALPSEIVRYDIRKQRMNSAGLMLSVGYQHEFFDFMVVDFNTGLGYAFNFDFARHEEKSFIETEPNIFRREAFGEDLWRFSHWAVGSSGYASALALHIGLSIGIAL